MKIALLGATGQLARSLTDEILTDAVHETVLFARRPDVLQSLPCRVEQDFSQLLQEPFDLIINGIGAGTPAVLQNHYENWFTVLEKFDNLVLEGLRKFPRTLYVSFSSGAVTRLKGLDPDNVQIPDYYALAKLYAEAKHRAHRGLRIADIRIYSFFSRHSPLDAGYFITDLAAAVKNKTILQPRSEDMIRDYIHPRDLWDLIQYCAARPEINLAIDAASAAPVSKLDLLEECQKEFGLHYTAGVSGKTSPNATVSVYIPDPVPAITLGFRAQYSSMEYLKEELHHV